MLTKDPDQAQEARAELTAAEPEESVKIDVPSHVQDQERISFVTMLPLHLAAGAIYCCAASSGGICWCDEGRITDIMSGPSH